MSKTERRLEDVLTALISGVLIAGGGMYIAIGVGLIIIGVCLIKGIKGG